MRTGQDSGSFQEVSRRGIDVPRGTAGTHGLQISPVLVTQEIVCEVVTVTGPDLWTGHCRHFRPRSRGVVRTDL